MISFKIKVKSTTIKPTWWIPKFVARRVLENIISIDADGIELNKDGIS
jgi:hypothetical protein